MFNGELHLNVINLTVFNNNIMELTSWIYILLAVLQPVFGSECTFPEEWRGRWHEGRRTEIFINSMSRKGTCTKKDGNKYFMLNTDSNNKKCFICLVFTQWHPNLLQYKASPCWYQNSFKEVCGLINGDDILHTLVRAPSSPQPCPFQGSYIFSYTNGTTSHLQCHTPMSEVRACADDSKFKFIFKKCNGIPGTYETTRDFQCLATWESGEKYLYGSFSQPSMTSVDEYQYRCFMHSFYGSNGDMSMSADSTCQGLQSPTLGVISMKFSKDYNEPRSSCTFLEALTNRNKWRNLAGNFELEVEAGMQVMRLKDRNKNQVIHYTEFPGAGESSANRLVIRCIQQKYEAEGVNSNVRQTHYLTYVTDDECESSLRCVRLIKRDVNILEMYLGEKVNSSTVRCDEDNFEAEEKHLFIPEVGPGGQCSEARTGVHTYQDKASDCSGTVTIGCKSPDKMEIETKCKDPTGLALIQKVEILNCYHSWAVDSKTFIITENGEEAAKCLIFIDTEYGVELQSDQDCKIDRWTVTNQARNYLLFNPPDKCPSNGVQADQTAPPKKGQTDHHNTLDITDGFDSSSEISYLSSVILAFTLLSHLIIR